MTWMCVSLSPADISAGLEMTLQEAFTKVWIAAGTPPDAIMYATRSARNSRCYFTPAAVNLAQSLLATFGAVDCPEPDVHKLNVLVRNEGAPIS
jgi:hypothetical protein